jgi:hypothetical protein
MHRTISMYFKVCSISFMHGRNSIMRHKWIECFSYFQEDLVLCCIIFFTVLGALEEPIGGSGGWNVEVYLQNESYWTNYRIVMALYTGIWRTSSIHIFTPEANLSVDGVGCSKKYTFLKHPVINTFNVSNWLNHLFRD